jgi:hypothetical protein
VDDTAGDKRTETPQKDAALAEEETMDSPEKSTTKAFTENSAANLPLSITPELVELPKD